MKSSLMLFGLLVVTCSADSIRTPFLDFLISGADRIRTGIKDVGSRVFSPITNKDNVGFQFGQIGMGYEEQLNQQRPHMNEDNTKTVIVIVENPDSGYDLPAANQYPHHQGPLQHNGDRPSFPARPTQQEYNPYGMKPWNQNNNNRPNYGQYDQNNEQLNHAANQDASEDSDKNNKQQGTPTAKPENTPDFDDMQSDKKYNDNGHAHDDKTKNPTNQPFRVPLNPNEYVYGGDKIEINAPKRETNTDEKKNADEDAEFPIDIRFSTE